MEREGERQRKTEAHRETVRKGEEGRGETERQTEKGRGRGRDMRDMEKDREGWGLC